MELFTYFALKNKAVVCVLAGLLESQEIFNKIIGTCLIYMLVLHAMSFNDQTCFFYCVFRNIIMFFFLIM